jgi:hypothetical protein
MKILPTICPSCGSQLKVKSLICEKCDTEIQGQYELSALASLSPDDQEFILEFMKASGSLKELAKLHQLSYPTIRNRLDEIIERIKQAEDRNKSRKEK